jgi:NAD(P)-dependent dehydrogenase (short-subunit alcohol dehydrogenase family)
MPLTMPVLKEILSPRLITEENWDKTIAINLKGIWLCMQHEITEMLIQGKGTIVNCSSVAGLVGFRTACIRCPSMA